MTYIEGGSPFWTAVVVVVFLAFCAGFAVWEGKQ